MFTCSIRNQLFPKATFKDYAFTKPVSPRVYFDVQELIIQECYFGLMPQLHNVFNNVTHLRIENCDLTNDLADKITLFDSLFFLSLDNNKISNVPDKFACCTNLKSLSMANNRINIIFNDFLDKLPFSKLCFVDFRNNLSYDIYYDADSGENIEEFTRRLKNFKMHQTSNNLIMDPNLAACSVKANKYLWESGDLSDLIIKAEEKTFKVHKMLLVANSIVFRKMFYHEMKESIKNELTITDFNAQTVEEFLLFIYTVSLPSCDENLMDIFAISAKYEVEELRDFCEQKIRFNLNEENASDIFQMAHLYDRTEMKQEAFNLFKKKIEKCFNGVKICDDLMNNPKELSTIIEAQKNFENVVRASKNVNK